jgi:hypothetical protein
MKLHEILVSIPQGYVLCPFPKQWLREYEEIKIVMPQEFLRELITTEVVLSYLSAHRAMIDWTTTYSGVKGSKEFLFGIQDDNFYILPNHNKVNYEVVSVRSENVRLYAKSFSKQSFSR